MTKDGKMFLVVLLSLVTLLAPTPVFPQGKIIDLVPEIQVGGLQPLGGVQSYRVGIRNLSSGETQANHPNTPTRWSTKRK